MSKPHVVLVYPHNGMVALGSAQGYYEALYQSQLVDVYGIQHNSSFVPLGYNMGLHSALKSRDIGIATHMAMLHADIEPLVPRSEPYLSWIDRLYIEMEETGADVVSAVAPYKEPAYERTTTVVGNPDNPWVPKRHILLSDRSNLPETFGIEDCGDAETEFLQVNTGLMLIDLRKPYWDIPREGATGDFFSFELMQQTIKVDRAPAEIAAEQQRVDQAIAALQSKPNKSPSDYEQIKLLRSRRLLDFDRTVQSRSEDWEMSRHVWQHGGRCVATWKIALNHWGNAPWCNQVAPPMNAHSANGKPDPLVAVPA